LSEREKKKVESSTSDRKLPGKIPRSPPEKKERRRKDGWFGPNKESTTAKGARRGEKFTRVRASRKKKKLKIALHTRAIDKLGRYGNLGREFSYHRLTWKGGKKSKANRRNAGSER